MIIYYKTSSKPDKKFMVFVNGKVVHFGAKGMSDYTIHKDKDRKQRYIIRHTARENWKKSGIQTPGFWSRWLLWNKPTLQTSIKDIEQKFNVTIKKWNKTNMK